MFQCPSIETSLGYELLDKGTFHILGSNSSELFTLGNQTAPTELRIYVGGNSNAAYTIGVDTPSDPLFYITRTDLSPHFFIYGPYGNIGIGSSTPIKSLDLWGDARILQSNIPQLQVGSTQSPSELHIYLANQSNLGFAVGVTNPTDPTFYITRIGETPKFYIQASSGHVGIGTSTPSYDMDVWGDMRVTGTLTQYNPGSNVTFITEIVSSSSNQVDFLSPASNEFISVTDSALCNIHSIQVNDQAWIGGELIINDVFRHYLGNMQNVRTCMGHISYNTSNLVELGFIISWPNVTHEYDFVQLDTDFFAIGHETTMGMTFKKCVDTNDYPPAFPYADFATTYDAFQNSNVALFQPIVSHYRGNSFKIGVQWQLHEQVPHTANIRLDAWAATDMGPLSIQGYQVLSNYISVYEQGGFSNPIFQQPNLIEFPDNIYEYGTARQILGNMQRIHLSLQSSTASNELGFLLSWPVPAASNDVFVTDTIFTASSNTFASDYVTTHSPISGTLVSLEKFYTPSVQTVFTPISSTSATLGVQWAGTSPSTDATLSIDFFAPASLGLLQVVGYQKPLSYYSPSLQTFVPTIPSPSQVYADTYGLIRQTMGYITTTDGTLGDVTFTASSSNHELGYILSWPIYKTNQVEIECVFTTKGDSNTYGSCEFIQRIQLTHETATADAVLYKMCTNSETISTPHLVVRNYAPYQAQIGIMWHTLSPIPITQKASLSLRLVAPNTLGQLDIGAYRMVNGIMEMYNPYSQTFVSTMTPMYMTYTTQLGILRQVSNGIQNVNCTLGNLSFYTAGRNNIGFTISCPHTSPTPPPYTLQLRSHFTAMGAHLRISSHINTTLQIPNITQRITTKYQFMRTDNVQDEGQLHITYIGNGAYNIYIEWMLTEPIYHVADLRLELIAPSSLGDLQVQGFFYDGLT